MTRTLIASDLDRTLVYSAAAAPSGGLVADPAGPGTAGLVVVERHEGRDVSFMTPAAATALAALAAREVVVPVTTRTPAQLARVRLPGPPPGTRSPRTAACCSSTASPTPRGPDRSRARWPGSPRSRRRWPS